MASFLDDQLRSAVQFHQSGRLTDAEVTYRRILAEQPNNPDALHLLGVLAGQTGHLDQAVQLVSKAVQLRPNFHQALANLGRLLADQGQPEQSMAAYRRVTELTPRDAMSWHALGLACKLCGNSDQATAAFNTAVELDPRLAASHNELAKLHRSAGRFDEAMAACRLAIEIQPGLADAHHTMANALLDKDLLEEAIAEYRLATELAPDVSQFHASLGDALCRKEQWTDAIGSYNSALTLVPNFGQARHGAGVALAGLSRYEEAIAMHKSAIELEPSNALWHCALGDTLSESGDVREAEKSFRKAIELKPDHEPFWMVLGATLNSMGRFDEAAQCFRKAIVIDPNGAGAYKNLASISRESADAGIVHLSELLSRPDLPRSERISAGFGLGKLLDDANRFDEAFHWYAEANRLYREVCERDKFIFDPAALRRKVDESIEHFKADFFAQRRSWGEETELPVFIVGMPRSGTTLAEQILASHSNVFGAGELTEISNYAPAVNATSVPADWTADKIGEIARHHLAHLKTLGGDAVRVVDKLPGNILHLGLVATLFPHARVIFCQRDPRDNCLSCYFQWFNRHSILFSYDLLDCATQYLEQERLRAHWLKALPLQMMTMQYEELVADLEGQSRRLIDFLGLEWDPACLNFHKTERTVVTASVWQVRQPLYNSSVGRWRHYEKHLGPLLKALQS